MSVSQGGGRECTAVTLADPRSAVATSLLHGIRSRLGRVRQRVRDSVAGYRTESVGEGLMREWLNLLTDTRDSGDGVNPGFLVSPLTNEPLEYDRWYPAYRVAFEFQGQQHFGPTEKYPDPDKARRQQANDLIKLGLSHRNGVTLVEVEAKHLSLEAMLDLMPAVLPRRNLDGLGAVVSHLETESRAYRRRAGIA